LFQVTVLTSSRADYSIYRPLLQLLKEEPEIKFQLVAFGTHTAAAFGNTVDAIKKDGYEVEIELPFVLNGNAPVTIAHSMAKTMEQFADVWNTLPTNLIICLGDRYEMFAAVAASVPFSIPIAHIHGGETTLGAMDNVFRHSLTHMASIHFAGSEAYRQRIIEMKGYEEGVFNTGALSIDNLQSLKLLSPGDFMRQFGVDLTRPTILTTFHPETVSFNKNEEYAKELSVALEQLTEDFQVIITMPNADTMGNVIREEMQLLAQKNRNHVFCFENLGTIGYLSAMKYSVMLLGNTSSGFVEASYFPKWVINLGNRQKGRLLTDNIKTIEIKKELIVKTVKELNKMPVPSIQHPYGNGFASINMMSHIKMYLDEVRYKKLSLG
jgi:GDP/UDP-N,N'-diacetylbacillosamine 2-epimerase (hydrolysing)